MITLTNPAPAALVLAIAHNGANHAAWSEDMDDAGFAPAACRSTLTVSVEHDNDGPIRADEHDVSCRRCLATMAKYGYSVDHTTTASGTRY